MMISSQNSTPIFNISSSKELKSIAITLSVMTIILACLTILFDIAIVLRLIYSGQFKKSHSKSHSRRIDLPHSINTYIHITSETTIFLLMSSRTFYGDFYLYNKEEITASLHCRLLNYFMSMFASGIYGSCFFQSLFRFWRVIKPDQILYRKFSFHFRLIVSNRLFILILSLSLFGFVQFIYPQKIFV